MGPFSSEGNMKLKDLLIMTPYIVSILTKDGAFKEALVHTLSAIESTYPKIFTQFGTYAQQRKYKTLNTTKATITTDKIELSDIISNIKIILDIVDVNAILFTNSYGVPAENIPNHTIMFTKPLGAEANKLLWGGEGISPAAFPVSNSIIGEGNGSDKKSSYTGYAGCTITPMVLMGGHSIFIPEITTVSYSTHAESFNVTPLGFSNRVGTTSGPRTIAGSIICQALREEPLQGIQPQNILESRMLNPSGDPENPLRENLLPDQLPLFDLFLFMQTEDGHQAMSSLYGVKINQLGITHSSQDSAIEFIYQYTATDMDPLTYLGKAEDNNNQIGFDVTLYKERIRLIDMGRTNHSTSSTDLAEFWDVIDNVNGVITAPQTTYDAMQARTVIKVPTTDGNIAKKF